VLDGWRWTIVVRDRSGLPVAGVPVSCTADLDETEEFQGGVLGLTDSAGRLVVKDPASVKLFRRPVPEEIILDENGNPSANRVGPPIEESEQSEFVWFEVEGMYLDGHAAKIDLADRAPSTVTLTMPPVTKVEVQLPTWRGPIGALVALGGTRSPLRWEIGSCWMDHGRHFALTGHLVSGSSIPFPAYVDGSDIHTEIQAPHLQVGEIHRVRVQLDEGDTIVRAKIETADGNAVAWCALRSTLLDSALRTRFVRADREGRIAVVCRASASTGKDFEFAVIASPDPDQIGRSIRLQVEPFEPGRHLDAGVVQLSK
jgi:hypothetical protein